MESPGGGHITLRRILFRDRILVQSLSTRQDLTSLLLTAVVDLTSIFEEQLADVAQTYTRAEHLRYDTTKLSITSRVLIRFRIGAINKTTSLVRSLAMFQGAADHSIVKIS